MGGQYCSDCDERVKLEEPVNRPGPNLPEFFAYCGDNAKPKKHREKEDLAYTSDGNNFHNHTFKAVMVFGLF